MNRFSLNATVDADHDDDADLEFSAAIQAKNPVAMETKLDMAKFAAMGARPKEPKDGAGLSKVKNRHASATSAENLTVENLPKTLGLNRFKAAAKQVQMTSSTVKEIQEKVKQRRLMTRSTKGEVEIFCETSKMEAGPLRLFCRNIQGNIILVTVIIGLLLASLAMLSFTIIKDHKKRTIATRQNLTETDDDDSAPWWTKCNLRNGYSFSTPQIVYRRKSYTISYFHILDDKIIVTENMNDLDYASPSVTSLHKNGDLKWRFPSNASGTLYTPADLVKRRVNATANNGSSPLEPVSSQTLSSFMTSSDAVLLYTQPVVTLLTMLNASSGSPYDIPSHIRAVFRSAYSLCELTSGDVATFAYRRKHLQITYYRNWNKTRQYRVPHGGVYMQDFFCCKNSRRFFGSVASETQANSTTFSIQLYSENGTELYTMSTGEELPTNIHCDSCANVMYVTSRAKTTRLHWISFNGTRGTYPTPFCDLKTVKLEKNKDSFLLYGFDAAKQALTRAEAVVETDDEVDAECS